MIYSLNEIIFSLPEEKKNADSYWTRWVLRPISYPLTWIFLALNLTPNAVTWIGAVCAVFGGTLFGLPGLIENVFNIHSQNMVKILQWSGILLLFLFSVLDCVDGNMARTLKKNNPLGAWVDAVGG